MCGLHSGSTEKWTIDYNNACHTFERYNAADMILNLEQKLKELRYGNIAVT